jgi:hypothetical protein
VSAQDGEWLHKLPKTLAEELFSNKDPWLANLQFFTSLRNKIEHWYERDIAQLIASQSQASLLNYETTLVDLFGASEGLSSQLRFPLFLSSIVEDAVEVWCWLTRSGLAITGQCYAPAMPG